ncbi:Urb2/Npa2 family-domain-containing protein, partial [Pisolithus tinctorius]
ALVRLRRPFVLHRLLLIIRRMRPRLGAKQSKLVAETSTSHRARRQNCSSWHTTQHTAIGVKTQKAGSLAKLFAKHVGHVLLAYIDSMNDPSCSLKPQIRPELKPGLFSLREMLGEYNRDALMVFALDSGRKTFMKSLWREYEEQQYVGKG